MKPLSPPTSQVHSYPPMYCLEGHGAQRGRGPLKVPWALVALQSPVLGPPAPRQAHLVIT